MSELLVMPLNFGAHAAGRPYEAGAIPHEIKRERSTGGFVFAADKAG